MFLKELSELFGVSSREGEVRDFIRDRICGKVDEVYTDSLGNLIAVKGKGLEGPRVMMAAHMDEVGLLVVGIEKSGLLGIEAVGSIDERVLVSKPVIVGEKKVPGVIGAKPIHLQERDERNKPIKMKSLFVDIGAKDRDDAERCVGLGDLVAFATTAGEFGSGLFKGKALDDRAGCSVVMSLADLTPPFPLYLVFTVQEEVGMRGARVAAYGVNPDIAVVFEGTTAGDVPGSKRHKQSTRVGKGPAITFMDKSVIVSKPLIERLVEVARESNIPYQYREATVGGTDAGAINLAREGIPAGVVSVPCRYIHSPVSVLSLDDLDNTVRLASGFLKSIETRGLPR